MQVRKESQAKIHKLWQVAGGSRRMGGGGGRSGDRPGRTAALLPSFGRSHVDRGPSACSQAVAGAVSVDRPALSGVASSSFIAPF